NPYPVGHHGRYLLSTSAAGRGSLISDAFVLGPDDRFFSVLIGSSRDTAGLRVELHVRSPDGVWQSAWQAAGPGIALLQQRVFAVPPALAGQQARIAIVDESPTAHVAVDYARFTATPPRPDPAPLWGVADYHAHPMSYLAFGALRGVRALWGRPGTAAAAYVADPARIELDLPPCSDDHGGGNTAGIFINVLEKRLLPQDLRPRGFGATIRALFRLLTGYFTRHGGDGAPRFE